MPESLIAMSTRSVFILISAMIVVTFCSLLTWLTFVNNKPTQPPIPLSIAPKKILTAEKPAPAAIPKQHNVPKYRITEDELTHDSPLRTQFIVSAFIPGRVTKQTLKDVLEHIYHRMMQRGPFNYRKRANYVWIYLHAREGQDWVAMASKTPSNEVLEIDIEEDILKTINHAPVMRFGLTEAQRQMAYRDIIRIERRASKESEEMYPWPSPKSDPDYLESADSAQLARQKDVRASLLKPLMRDLAVANRLTALQLEEIGTEGLTDRWSFPPLSD